MSKRWSEAETLYAVDNKSICVSMLRWLRLDARWHWQQLISLHQFNGGSYTSSQRRLISILIDCD